MAENICLFDRNFYLYNIIFKYIIYRKGQKKNGAKFSHANLKTNFSIGHLKCMRIVRDRREKYALKRPQQFRLYMFQTKILTVF